MTSSVSVRTIHLLMFIVCQISLFANCADACDNSARLQEVLVSMNKAAQNLQSAQSELSYLTIEDPDLLNSKVLRTGILYFLKTDNRSYLRMHFRDIKQDDFEPESRREEYLFDGVWLTRIDYKLKQIDKFQQSTEDNPVDVFELISHNFPLVGFTDSNSIHKDFDVSLPKVAEDPNDSIHLKLTSKTDSPFSKEYSHIDLWVDKALFLPSRIMAFSVQGDIHDIKFLDLTINKNLERALFTVEKPTGFRENIEPLKSTRK